MYELSLLDTSVNGEVDDATRDLLDLNAGECSKVFWFTEYPRPVDPDLNGTVLSYTVWSEALTGGVLVTDSIDSSVTLSLRDTISANANKLNGDQNTVSPTGPYVNGQLVEICYLDPDFGIIGDGETPSQLSIQRSIARS